jgi:hypothetical protein
LLFFIPARTSSSRSWFISSFSQHCQPLVHRFNTGFCETTRAFRAVDPPNNESRVFEHLQMLRDAGRVISNGSVSSMTVASPWAKRARIARRVGSARAEKPASRLYIGLSLYKSYLIAKVRALTEIAEALKRPARRGIFASRYRTYVDDQRFPRLNQNLDDLRINGTLPASDAIWKRSPD